ncbi:MAG: hypothetical protein AB7E55_02435 [Pigmentiphaga sp.]
MSAFRRLILPAALAAALALPAAAAQPEAAPASQPQAGSQTYELSPEGAMRRTLARGVYQVVYSPAQEALYVASSEAMPDVQGGVIYKLDPGTLETIGLIHTDEKNFGLALDTEGKTLFVSNSVGGAVSKIDLEKGKVLGRIVFPERSADGSAYGPRTVLYDASGPTLYVSGVGDPGRIWAIDPESFTVRASIGDAGKWVTGLLRDPRDERLFATNGDGEVLVIDTRTNEIRHRWKPVGDEPALLLNFALDAAGNRLFVTDHSRQKAVLVLDARTGQLQRKLPVGESLDILLQPERNALYLTHRERGEVSVIDATTYEPRQRYSLPQHPNSLTLSPDGNALYVTIKTPFTPEYHASGEGSVARIELPGAPR